jgi:hypothetical protein
MRLLITALLVVSPALALADEPAPSRAPSDITKMKNDDCAKARKQNKPCVIDMGGEEIDGTSPTAGGTVIGTIQFHKAESLIRIRRDFIAEILKTAEDL